MGDIQILLVEDNQGDIHLIQRVFNDYDLPGTLHSVQTGEAALDWLNQRGEYADAPRPDIVLLDLNLPAMSGHEVLREIKQTPELARIPVLVLTGSQAEDDLVKAYDSHANAYLNKPVDPEEFVDLFELITGFWISTVILPPKADTGPRDQK